MLHIIFHDICRYKKIRGWTVKKVVRIKEIEKYVAEHEFVTLNELSQKFSVHINTIRSDVNELAQLGVLEKSYGGVTIKTERLPSSYRERMSVEVESKKILGVLAAELLEEEDVVYIDSGTTAQMIFEAPNLPKHLTVITGNLAVINKNFLNTNYNVFVLPGKLERDLNSFASLETIDSIKSYNIQKAFVGVRGISERGDLSSASQIDAKLKKTILEVSQKRILMAGADKVHHPAVINFASLKDVDTWVCDRNTDIVRELVEKYKIELIVPKK